MQLGTETRNGRSLVESPLKEIAIHAIFNNNRESFSFLLTFDIAFSFLPGAAMCVCQCKAFQQSLSQLITVTNWSYSLNNTVQLCTHSLAHWHCRPAAGLIIIIIIIGTAHAIRISPSSSPSFFFIILATTAMICLSFLVFPFPQLGRSK